MAFVIKFVKGVRNHWKKSTFAAIALTYGANYTNDYIETQNLMRQHCERARKYGRQPLARDENPRNITVILNPNANRRKAVKLFENYCAPILNLAGICVDVVQTQSEGHARTLVEELKKTDAIIIAGGDGTLSEAITGLMRRPDSSDWLKTCPVGVLPVGRTNTFARGLFLKPHQGAAALAEAAMAIVEEAAKDVDVMKIEILHEDPEEGPKRPIFALARLEWGAYRDAHSRRDKYWYFGALRSYVTYIFNGLKSELNWNCRADLVYSEPCSGCRNCYQRAPKQNVRWWRSFISSPRETGPDYSNIINENCSKVYQKQISTADLLLSTIIESRGEGGPSQLNLTLGPSSVRYLHFVEQGWQSERGEKRDVEEIVGVRQLEILPQYFDDKQLWFSIDNEDYEVKPIKVTLLPKILRVYCTKKDLNKY